MQRPLKNRTEEVAVQSRAGNASIPELTAADWVASRAGYGVAWLAARLAARSAAWKAHRMGEKTAASRGSNLVARSAVVRDSPWVDLTVFCSAERKDELRAAECAKERQGDKAGVS